MSKKILDKMISNNYNERLNFLRKNIHIKVEDAKQFTERNNLINEVQTMKLNYEDFENISAENVLFYLNYNNNFAMKKLNMIQYKNRIELLNRFLKIDLSKKENLTDLSDFLQWSICSFCKDEDMAKLMQYFCDNVDYKKTNLIFEVYSIYQSYPYEFKCKNIIVKKHNEILKQQKDKLNSRIIL